jgi:hypothetical protein
MKKLPLILILAAALGSSRIGLAQQITPKGQSLTIFLDSLNVERLWLAGARVDWRTGAPNGKPILKPGRHTHCSEFSAAAAERLGIYLPRPPDYSANYLANAQYDWLTKDGPDQGWSPVPDAFEAQRLADDGDLVVAVLKSRKPKTSGHIAIVRPSGKGRNEIFSDGPQIIQAGFENLSSTTLRHGFKNHRGAWTNAGKTRVLFFAHEVDRARLDQTR